MASSLVPEGDTIILDGGYKALVLDRSDAGQYPQGVYKIHDQGRDYIFKVFAPKVGFWGQWIEYVTSDFWSGRTSPSPKARYRIEKAVLKLWRSHGFGVFPEPENPPPVDFGAPTICLDYVEGEEVAEELRSAEVPLAGKLDLIRQLAAEFHRRHELARSTGNRLFLHEHPTLRHIWRAADDGRLINFDFEITYHRFTNMESLIARELLAFARSILVNVSDAERDACLDVLLEAYPDRAVFERAYRAYWKSLNPIVRIFRFFERMTKRSRRPLSRPKVARLIHQHP
jgi:hypothetical protein